MELASEWQDWELSMRTKLKTGLQMQIKGSCFIILIWLNIWISTCLARFKMIIGSRRGLPPQFGTHLAFSTHHYQPVIAGVNIFFCSGWEMSLVYETPSDCVRQNRCPQKGGFRTVYCLQQSTCLCEKKMCVALWLPVSRVSYREMNGQIYTVYNPVEQYDMEQAREYLRDWGCR